MNHIFTGTTSARFMRPALLCLLSTLFFHDGWSQAVPCDAARIATSGSTCAGCAVLNADYASDDNIISASTLSPAPGSADTYVQQVFQFSGTSAAGDSAYVYLSFPAPVTNPQILQSIQLSSYLNSAYNNDRKAITSDSLRIQWYTPQQALVSWAPTKSYNRLGVRLIAGAATAVNIHYASSGVSKPHLAQDSIGICAGMAVNLKASGAPGTVINWYTQSFGGCPVYTGNTFTTPPLSSPVTYYVEAAKDACANQQRLPVKVNILPGASTVTKQWDKTFGGTSNDVIVKILPANDGNYLMAGYTNSNDRDITDAKGSTDFWLLKVTPDGTKLWSKTYGGSGADLLSTILPAGNGAYLLAGYANSGDGDVTDGNNGGTDYWVVKVDTNGNKLWNRSFGGSQGDWLYSAQPTSDGGYLLAGYTDSNDGDVTDGNNGTGDAWIVKLDANGNKLWDKTYGGSKLDVINSILPTADGAYLLGGYTGSYGGDITNGTNGNYDYWLIKIDGNGNKLWDKSYGGTLDDRINTMIPEGNGYLLVGETESNNGDVRGDMRGGRDIWVVRIDADGNRTWNRTYGGNGNEFVSTIIPAGDDNFLLGGGTTSDNLDVTDGNNGGLDWWVLKINPQQQGEIIWDKTWGGNQNDYIDALRLTPDGSLLVAGNTLSTNGDVTGVIRGAADAWLLKATIPNCSVPLRVASALVDTIGAFKQSATQETALTVFPNPFSDRLSIRYTVQKAGRISIQLYNIQGLPVMNVKNATLQPGNYNESVDGSRLNSGTYVCRMLLNGEMYSQTLIKL